MKTFTLLFILLFGMSVFGQEATKPAIPNIYWDADKSKCSICDDYIRDGSHRYVFNTPDIGILFAASYNDKLAYNTVLILNKSENRLNFNPATDTVLIYYKNKDDKTPEFISPLKPEDAAQKIKGSQGMKNFFSSLGAALQKQAITGNSTTDGTASVFGTGGMATGVYNERTTTTVLVPDTDAQARARDTIAERNRLATERYNDVINSALLANTIFPKKSVVGNIYFPLVKGGVYFFGIKIGGKLYLKSFKGI